MSTKSQNLKRKHKGEFKNIESLEVDKKIFKEGNQTQVVKKKNFNNKKEKGGEGNAKKKEKMQNKKMNKTIIQAENNEDNQGDLQGNITLGQINGMVTKLWSKRTSEKEKQKLIDVLIKKLEPILYQLVHKREGSRAVQACIKYGTEQQQLRVFKVCLKGNFAEIVKSKYGHFLALRIIKFVKDKEIKKQLFDKLFKDVYYLVSHVEGAKVIDQYMRNLAKPAELTQIKKVFDDVVARGNKPDESQKLNFEGIDNLALKIIDKQNHYPLISKHILQIALPVLVEAEREKVIEYLKEKILDLIEDREGVKLCLDLINYAQAKDRKTLIKNVKDHVMKIIQSDSTIAFFVILKLIHSVDDTVLVEKQIIKPMKTQFKEVMESKHGFAIISSIFIPQHNALKTIEKEVKYTTSKKDSDIRLQQLQGPLLGDCVEYLKSLDDEKLLKNFGISRFLSGIIKIILQENKSEYFDFVKSILEKLLNEKQVANEKDFETNSILNNIDGHRILKGIITLAASLTEGAKEFIDEYVEKTNQFVSNNIELFVQNRSSIYIVIALIEQTSYKDFIIQQVKSLNIKKISSEKVEGKDSVAMNIIKQFL